MRTLLSLPREDIDACIEAYEFMVNGTSDIAESAGDVDVETDHARTCTICDMYRVDGQILIFCTSPHCCLLRQVRAYYAVANEMLAVVDIEKMYIPPQIDAREGLFGNQMLWEKRVFDTLALPGGDADARADARLLDVGCGRGRISHHAAAHTGARVSGFNIDARQIDNAKAHANATGSTGARLDFKVGDHHKPFAYGEDTFDGAYSFQAIWPFFKKAALDDVARELFRVLKPGSKYSCSEYLLTPHFDQHDPEHMRLHALFLPTLAATQSNYPADVTAALERAGFEVLLSAPSSAPAWPLTDQKTDLFLTMRSIVVGLNKLGVVPAYVLVIIDNFLQGGQAWAAAEKMKIADLNWRIIAQKPSM